MNKANHAARYIPNIILTLQPLVQSRIRTLRRAAPSQTEVTDLNSWRRILSPRQMDAHQKLATRPFFFEVVETAFRHASIGVKCELV